jgi:sulfatase maturation enzyme AslB (radical SAM superfamily)
MSVETAKRIVDCIFLTPSPQIKIEFQGGEPLLNWRVIEETVKYSQRINKTYKKSIEFVICTNLTLINEDQIKFCKDNNIYISTSLDGPKPLHNKNRKLRSGDSSYDLFLKKLSLAYKHIPEGSISALMTTSSSSLYSFPSIIDEYMRNGFR